MIQKCGVLVLLMGIAWQDFKFRAVYWWLFPALMLGLGLLKYQESSGNALWLDLAYNVGFLGLQLLFLSLYFSLKEKRWVNIFKAYFGLGDLLFLIIISSYLSFLNYLAFYIWSLCLIVIITLTGKWLNKDQNPKIPLAGEQAILFLMLMLIDFWSKKMDLTSDGWLSAYLMWAS